MRKVYLAGPEVFLPDAAAVLAQKAALAREYGFHPLTPGGPHPGADVLGAFDFGLVIGRSCEAQMNEADFVIANLTPYRGIGADTGTVFEVGFMRGQGKPLFAYTNTTRDHFARVSEDHYRGAELSRAGLLTRGPDGLLIEDHAMRDNLMIDTAIHESGGSFCAADAADPARDMTAFRAALMAARTWWAAR